MTDSSDVSGSHTDPPPPESDGYDIVSNVLKNSKSYTAVPFRSAYAKVGSPAQRFFSQNIPTATIISQHSPNKIPTTPANVAERNFTRGRGLSRSSSVPSLIRRAAAVKNSDKQSNDDASNSPKSVDSVENNNNAVLSRHDGSSVKHLTCFWWKEKGTCRFSDEDCLYAHYDTGHYTDPPRQLVPGEPALAGRKLDRAMRNLAIAAHRSSGSMSSTPGSRHGSRPSTPTLHTDPGSNSNVGFTSPLTPPVMVISQYGTDLDLARLTNDNQFLRTLVDQNGKEKAIMISTIETLQSDNKGMKGELDGLRKAQEQLLVEREGLHKRIKILEEGQMQTIGTARSINNPFGAIGRGRVNTETRYLGGLLNED